jgi:hypothetical protein
MIQPITRGEDSRRNWKTINQCIAEQGTLWQAAREAALAIGEMRRRPRDVAGSLQTVLVKSAEAEYLVCRSWDGTTEGSDDIIVAKPFSARQPASETLLGVTYDYTYETADALNDYRNVTGGATIQQIVVPVWVVDGLILVAQTSFSGVTYDDTVNDPYDLKLIEVSARCWAGPTSA